MGKQYDILGKNILVTGANRGIGKAIVEVFLDNGAAKAYAAVRNPESAAELVEKYGDKVVPVKLDLSEPESITAAAKAATDVDVVINNGGILKESSVIGDNTFETFKAELEVNVYGLIRVAKAFAPVLKANGGGVLAQLNSVASLKSFPGIATYSASKAASYSFTQALKAELEEQGTTVLSVHPGPIATDMAKDAGIEDIAEPPELVAEEMLAALKAGELHCFPDKMAKQFLEAYQGFSKAIVEANLMEG